MAGEEQTNLEVPGDPTRSRIIDATFNLLMERGYAAATTNEIARRARVSKRELYALFDSKEGILAAMIAGRVSRMRQPLTLPEAADRAGMGATLTLFGIGLLLEGSNPAVIAMMRLAIAEAERAPDLARRIDEDGRQPTRAALTDFLRRASERGLIARADIDVMAERFFALLWGELLPALLFRQTQPPTLEAAAERAKSAVAALLTLYPEPVSGAG